MTDKTITREDIIRAISDKSSLPIKESEKILRSILSLMEDSIIQDHALKLSSFGSFEVIFKGQRMGRNPRTCEDKVITPRKVVVFRASDKLKDKILAKKALKTSTKKVA